MPSLSRVFGENLSLSMVYSLLYKNEEELSTPIRIS
jgi:hypothetical protein